MDNNLINIDDLVRQRLQGVEERENSVAWSRMRDLLDKEMPENKKRRIAVLPWRGIMGAILLLGAISVGGYLLNQDNNLLSITQPSKENNIPKSIADNIANASDALRPSSSESPLSNGKEEHENVLNQQALAKNSNTKLADKQTTQKDFEKKNELFNSNSLPKNLANTKTDHIGHQQKIGADNQAVKTISKNNQPKSSPQPPTGNESAMLTGTATAVEKRNNLKPPASPLKQNTIKSETTPVATLIRDTITQILAREYYKLNAQFERTLNIDTLSVERIPRETWVVDVSPIAKKKQSKTKDPKALQTPQQTGDWAATPAQNLGDNKELNATIGLDKNDPALSEDVAMVPLSQNRVNRKQLYLPGHTNTVKEMMDRTKYGLSQIHFYPGISGGVHTRYTGQGMMGGFQAGFTGLFAFYRNWSLMVEMKYNHSFNNGQRIQDNYLHTATLDSGYYQVGTTQRKYYEMRKDSVSRGYKFSMMQSLEMPISLRYAVGRVDVLAGFNLHYYFPISVEDASHNFTVVSRDSSLTSPPSIPYKQTPTITLADFGSRFGLGYLFGASYQITPAVNLDLRFSKMFLDNGKTPGEKRVSNQLFKAPAIQLNVGYRFGSNKVKR